MSKTSENTSLRVITGVFLFFLFLIGFSKFDEAYIQLKHSVEANIYMPFYSIRWNWQSFSLLLMAFVRWLAISISRSFL